MAHVTTCPVCNGDWLKAPALQENVSIFGRICWLFTMASACDACEGGRVLVLDDGKVIPYDERDYRMPIPKKDQPAQNLT